MTENPLPDRLADVRVHARVVLPETAVRLEDLAALVPGALVTTALPAATRAELSVNGFTLAGGEVVASDGRLALLLEEVL